MPKLTALQIEEGVRNGFDEESLAAYLAERDRVAGLCAGNVVTPWQRPKPAIRHESAMKGWNPFKRKWGR